MQWTHIGLLGLPLLLSGCASALLGLSADQIEAMAKIKDAGLTCIQASVGAMGGGKLVVASMDRGIYGTLSVDPDCRVSITTRPAGETPTK